MRAKLKRALEQQRVIGFTGSACAGKDYLAQKLGAYVEGMAVPLYWMTECLFGLKADDRGAEGLRETWQMMGQWGKGTVNSRYPVTPERGVFCQFVRDYFDARDDDYQELYNRDLCVDWQSYGLLQDIWIEALIDRVDARRASHQDHLIAVTGLRFPFEVKAMAERGWPVLHVMASPTTLGTRQMAQNITDAAREDVSESFAWQLNGVLWDVVNRTTPTPDVPDLLEQNDIRGVWGAVWNDQDTPCRNPDFLTPDELCGMVPCSAPLTPNELRAMISPVVCVIQRTIS